VYKDTIYFSLSEDGSIIALDIKTGEFLKRWDKFDETQLKNLPKQLSTRLRQLKYSDKLHFSYNRTRVKDGVIYGISGDLFWVLDLERGELKVSSVSFEFNQKEIGMINSPIVIKGNKLCFFTDQSILEYENENHKFVVFDIATQKVEQEWQLEKSTNKNEIFGFNIWGPILHDDYILLRDSKDVCFLLTMKD